MIRPGTYYSEHRDEVLHKTRLKRQINIDSNREYTRIQVAKWRAENRERNLENRRKWKANARAKAEYRISEFVTNSLSRYSGGLKNCSGAIRFMDAVFGLDRESAMRLAGQTPDLQWDHIVPKSAFNLKNPEHLVRCCYHQNVRRITAEENMRKQNTHSCLDIMSLPWCGSNRALLEASRVIMRFSRLQTPSQVL